MEKRDNPTDDVVVLCRPTDETKSVGSPSDSLSMDVTGSPPAGAPQRQGSGGQAGAAFVPFTIRPLAYRQNSDRQAALRRRAEAVAREKAAQSAEPLAPISPEATRIVLHELRVHQIELEMQNEELRRAQVELDASRARYFDLYDLAPVGYVTVDEKEFILEANLIASSLLGAVKGALVQQPLSRFIFEADQAIWYLHRKQLLATGEPQSRELRMVKSDGTPFWAHLAATVAKTSDGAPVCRVTLSNITMPKQAEEAARGGEKQFRTVLETMTLIGVILDRTGKITLCNDSLLSLTGWKREEVINQSWFDLFLPPEIRETVRHEVFSGPIADGDVPVHFENEIVTRQGVRRLIVWNNTLLRDYAGSITGVASIGEDITARRQAEAEVRQLNADLERRVRERTADLERSALSLQQGEQQHRTILRTAMDGFWRVDSQGHLLEVNESYCRMSGYSEPELLAMSIPDLEATETAANTTAHLQKIMRRGDDRFESRHRRKDRSIFAVEVSVQHKPSEGGHMVAFLRDITERKRVMDELQSRAIQQAALAELSRCALANEESPAFFDTVARVVARALTVEFCGMLQLLPDQRALKMVAGVGWREGLAGHAVLALEPDSDADYTLAREQPVIVEDLRTEGRFSKAALLRDHGVVSGLSVRIGSPEGTWGVLGAHTLRQRSFTPDEADFIQTAAHLLGTVIARRTTEKALLDMSRHLQEAEDAERRRIAKELHDSTAQDLVAVILNLETLREAASVRDPAEASQIEDSIALLEHSAHEIRTLSYLLHPPQLQDSGLTGAVRHYIAGFGERTGIVTSVDLPAKCPELEQIVELVLYRMVQESLVNVYRHAHSSCAAVRLTREGDDLVLEIRDEGRGMPAQPSAPEFNLIPGLGVGLPAMRERLRQIGGHLEIESTPHGTTVRARVPVKD